MVNPGRPDDPAGVPSAEEGPRLLATVYLAISLPDGSAPGGSASDGLAEIQLALSDATRKMAEAGHTVRYLNGMYMPAQTRLLCVFAAESEEVVHTIVKWVRLPFVPIKAITDRLAAADQDVSRSPRP